MSLTDPLPTSLQMSLIDPLQPDFEIVGVADAGIPNSERVVLRPSRRVSLRGFGITLGIFIGTSEGAMPIHDNVFWFPDMIVEPPYWVFVYTSPGTMLHTTMPWGEPALVLHWHRPVVVFTDPVLVPVLFEIEFARIGHHLPSASTEEGG